MSDETTPPEAVIPSDCGRFPTGPMSTPETDAVFRAAKQALDRMRDRMAAASDDGERVRVLSEYAGAAHAMLSVLSDR